MDARGPLQTHSGSQQLIATAIRASRAFGRCARQQTGIVLETTYTGKALAAAIRDAPNASGKTVLFWNTHASQLASPERPDARKLPEAFRVYFRDP